MSDPRIPNPHAHRILRPLLRLVFGLFYRFESRGKENVPRDGPALLAPNHVSFYDPFLVGIGQNRPLCYMAWNALFRPRLFGALIRWFGAFPVATDRLDPRAYRTALRCLQQGRCVVIFPEGGRSPDGTLQPLRRGVARLALRAGVPIVPVRVDGGHECWPPQRKYPRLFMRLRVTYGPPIAPRADVDHPRHETAEAELIDRLERFLAAPGVVLCRREIH